MADGGGFNYQHNHKKILGIVLKEVQSSYAQTTQLKEVSYQIVLNKAKEHTYHQTQDEVDIEPKNPGRMTDYSRYKVNLTPSIFQAVFQKAPLVVLQYSHVKKTRYRGFVR